MQKNLLFTASMLITAMLVSSQTVINRCGTYELMQQYELQNPGYLDRVNACFDHARQKAIANTGNRSVGDTIYRIQTVFHVVHTKPVENIPDSVIYSQLEVLNEDFRRKNADTVNTRPVFRPFAGDAHMEFYLATIDPDGNPTTGITRTAGTPGFLGFEPFTDNVKSAASGGKNPWPTDRYLNIWVCNVLNGFGVLGYSFPPSNAPNWPNGATTDSAKQGVVLHYPVVGRNFSAPIDPTVDAGRSLTHELGHYFGLRHIWGDGDCTVDDGISDTPASDAAHQQTCDTTDNSCVDSPVDYPDMVENFMDYSDDRCLNMFTHEQIGILHAMLQTSRAGIATVDIESGVKDISDFEVFDLYPTPSTGVINIQVRVANGVVYGLEIFNAIGERLLAERSLRSSVSKTLDLSAHPAGIYFARLSSGGQTMVRKFQLSVM